jgi:hypothetical protein
MMIIMIIFFLMVSSLLNLLCDKCSIQSTKQNNVISLLNAELNPICHLLALLGAHNILHVSRIRVKCRIKNSICHLLALFRAHHILHVSRIRVKRRIKNPICHLLALFGAHHILHVSRIRVNIAANRVHALYRLPMYCSYSVT